MIHRVDTFRRTAIAGLLALLAACPLAAQSGAEERRLDNGLRVLLRPLPGAPNVALVVLFSVGGRHDPEGQSGLAHLVEHVYVTAAAGGASARTVEQYVQLYPAGWNAQTGDDYTVVATVFPREKLDAELGDAAARMGELRIDEADLEREKPRLAAEVGNMFGGIPPLAAANLARERLRPTPGGGRKGGLLAHVAGLGVKELSDRWRRFYKPGNAIVALAGGFDPAVARPAVERLFGALPPGEPVPAAAPLSEPQAAAEPATLAVLPPGSASEVCLAFTPPAFDDPRMPAFLVLVARLWQRAPALSSQPGRFPVQWSVLDDPGIMTLGIPAVPGENPERALERLETFLRDALAPTFQAHEASAAREAFGFLLGLVELPAFALAQNPYGVAFSAARRAQLGFDPARLGSALDGLNDEALRRAAELFARERRAAVVLTP